MKIEKFLVVIISYMDVGRYIYKKNEMIAVFHTKCQYS